jgi:hypothetical protein
MAGALIAVTIFLSFYQREPAYEGRSLSSWIIEMRNGKHHQKARTVVHHLGTNSIPLLLEWLQRPDRPTPRERLRQAERWVIGWLEGHRWMKPRAWSWEMDWRGSYRALAQGAFLELGPDGKEAIPTLIQWLGRRAGTTNELSEVAGAAFLVLVHMAPASIPPLIEALSSPDDQVWALAAGALARIGPDAKVAIPVLQNRLHDKNPMIRAGAADVIGKLGGDPREFMPIVIETFREPDLEWLDYKLDILLRYKEYAKNAVPLLMELLRKTPESGSVMNKIARDQLKSALRQLDPEALSEKTVE